MECNEKFESVDKFIEHVNEGECDHCGIWLCCGTYLRKHKKKEHEITSEEGSKEEENKKDSNEDEEKGEVGIMVCEVSNHRTDRQIIAHRMINRDSSRQKN